MNKNKFIAFGVVSTAFLAISMNFCATIPQKIKINKPATVDYYAVDYSAEITGDNIQAIAEIILNDYSKASILTLDNECLFFLYSKDGKKEKEQKLSKKDPICATLFKLLEKNSTFDSSIILNFKKENPKQIIGEYKGTTEELVRSILFQQKFQEYAEKTLKANPSETKK